MALVYTATGNPAIQTTGAVSVATFTSVSIGTVASDRIVVVNVAAQSAAPSNQLSGVTIGGITATLAAASVNTNQHFNEQWYAAVPTGTTATVVATIGTGVFSFCGIVVSTLTGSASSPSSTAIKSDVFTGDPQTTSSALTIPVGGIGIVGGSTEGSNASPTWNVGTQDFNTNPGANMSVLLGHISTSGSQTPSISGYPGVFFEIASSAWAASAGGPGKVLLLAR